MNIKAKTLKVAGVFKVLKILNVWQYKKFFVVAMSLVVVCACTSTNNKQNSGDENQQVLNYEQSNKDYLNLVNKVKGTAALAEDYDALIRVFPLTSFYQPTSSDEQSAKLISQTQMRAGMWRACYETNLKLLKLNYTSLTGHYGASVCAFENGLPDIARFHNSVLDNFIEAIWRTGTGQTPDSPLYITSKNDLYAFIQLHQLVAVGQSLSYVNQLPVQAIKIQNPETGSTFTWYFDVTPEFRRGMIDKIEKNQ